MTDTSKRTRSQRRAASVLRRATIIHRDDRRVTWMVPEIGHVSATYIEPRTSNNPSDHPWHLINWGTTHATLEAALAHACQSYFAPRNTLQDRTYERMEAAMTGPGRFEY